MEIEYPDLNVQTFFSFVRIGEQVFHYSTEVIFTEGFPSDIM